MNANEQVYEVPLVELLERVPKDARFWVEEKHSSTHYPVGRLSHEAAEMLRQQQAEIAELKHMNRNWQISENILLLELEKLQHCELTDEEITEIWINHVTVASGGALQFARAILKKAQK